jgi:hypothetical protein
MVGESMARAEQDPLLLVNSFGRFLSSPAFLVKSGKPGI